VSGDATEFDAVRGRRSVRRGCVMWAVSLGLGLGLVYGVVGVEEAYGQQRFGIDIVSGVTLPLTPPIRGSAELPDRVYGTETGSQVPVITDRVAGAGPNFGLRVINGSIEVSYMMRRHGWLRARVLCESDREVQRLPDGRLDDSAHQYTCFDDPLRVDLARREERPIVIHTLGAALRFYMVRRQSLVVSMDASRVPDARSASQRGRPDFYAVVGPSLAITRFTLRDERARIRAGFALGVGGGMDIRLDRTLSINADIRYGFVVLSRDATSASTGGHAVTLGRRVVASVVDRYHQIDASVALRINFR